MSILVEAITVIVRNTKVEATINGGVNTLRHNAPNGTFRTDGYLSAVGFMTPEDAERYIDALKNLDFTFVENDKSVDIVVCDQLRGFTADCEWAGTDTDERGVRFCWLYGEDVGDMVTQEGWTYEKSLYTTGSFHDTSEPDDQLEFLRTENGLNVYLDKQTGKEVFAGRPFEVKDDIHTARLKKLLFCTASKVAYDQLRAEGWMAIEVSQDASEYPHFIMRNRNQLGVIYLQVKWVDAPLSVWTEEKFNRLVGLADHLKAIPLLISINISGQVSDGVNTAKDVFDSPDIEFALTRPYLAHDLKLNKEWSINDYDLEEEIELTEWEIHDFGIQVVRESLEREGHNILGWTSKTDAPVQISAELDGVKTFIAVNTVRYPEREAIISAKQIGAAKELAGKDDAALKTASVSIASADDPFDPSGAYAYPILRGEAANASFDGLADPE